LRRLSIPAIAWWAGYHRSFMNLIEFPEAARLKDHLLALPIHQDLNGAQIEFIGRKAIEYAAAA